MTTRLSSFQSKLAILLATSVMSGCAMLQPKKQEVVITVPPKYTENVPIPKVQPTDLKNVKWKLMNKAEMQQFLASSKEDVVIYTLDDENVAILIGNIQELRRYIQSQQEVIEYLKKILDARTEKGEK